jgi:hypothetical protein
MSNIQEKIEPLNSSKKVNGLSKISTITMFERNALRMSKGQAKLYLYLKECADNNINVNIESIVDLYWNDVKGGGETLICKDGGYILRTIKYKDAKEYFENDYYRYKTFIINPAKTWLSNNIGCLAMRGFLTVIPNFDTKLIEE